MNRLTINTKINRWMELKINAWAFLEQWECVKQVFFGCVFSLCLYRRWCILGLVRWIYDAFTLTSGWCWCLSLRWGFNKVSIRNQSQEKSSLAARQEEWWRNIFFKHIYFTENRLQKIKRLSLWYRKQHGVSHWKCTICLKGLIARALSHQVYSADVALHIINL